MPEDEFGEHVCGPECGPLGGILQMAVSQQAAHERRGMELTDFANRVREALAQEMSEAHVAMFAEVMHLLGEVQNPVAMANFWEGLASMAVRMRQPQEPAPPEPVACAAPGCYEVAASRAEAVLGDWLPRAGGGVVCPRHAAGRPG